MPLYPGGQRELANHLMRADVARPATAKGSCHSCSCEADSSLGLMRAAQGVAVADLQADGSPVEHLLPKS